MRGRFHGPSILPVAILLILAITVIALGFRFALAGA